PGSHTEVRSRFCQNTAGARHRNPGSLKKHGSELREAGLLRDALPGHECPRLPAHLERRLPDDVEPALARERHSSAASRAPGAAPPAGAANPRRHHSRRTLTTAYSVTCSRIAKSPGFQD